MSSPDSKSVFPEITEESSVPELMAFVRSSFRQEDFHEVERLLVGREEKMEMELRNLKRDYEEMKKKCQSLEAQNLELEEKLKKRRIKCQELRQQLVSLEIEKSLAEDMVTLRDAQLMGLTSRVSNLEEAVARLLRVPVAIIRSGALLAQERTQVQVSANGVVLPVYDGHNRGMNIENLRNGNLKNGDLQNRNLQNGNLQNGAVNHVGSENGEFHLENLHKELGVNFENHQTMDSFLNSQLQFACIISGTQFPDLPKEETAASDHDNAEASSGAQLTFDCAEVENVASDKKEERNGSPDTDLNGKELLESNARTMNGHDVVLCSTDVQAACDAPEVGTDSIHPEKENKTLLAAALTNTDNGCDNQMGGPKQLVIETDSSNQAAASCIPVSEAPGSPIVIEISDSDEENLPAGSTHFFTTCASDINSTGKKVPFINIGKGACFMKIEEEDGTGSMEDCDIYQMPKRKRSMIETSDTNFMVAKRKKEENGQLLRDENGSLGSDSSVKLVKSAGLEPLLLSVQNRLGEVRKGGSVQIGLKKSLFDDNDYLSDCTSSDSESESCLEAYVDKMVAIAKGYRLKTWNFAADMLSDLEKDDELCMNAVCALYRKKNSAEKSPMKSSVLADPGFSYCDAMSVTQLAEFLIDGDPEFKLKRTVSDAQQKDPKVLSKCKDLAIQYYEKLFELYQNGQDPFFHPKF